MTLAQHILYLALRRSTVTQPATYDPNPAPTTAEGPDQPGLPGWSHTERSQTDIRLLAEMSGIGGDVSWEKATKEEAAEFLTESTSADGSGPGLSDLASEERGTQLGHPGSALVSLREVTTLTD